MTVFNMFLESNVSKIIPKLAFLVIIFIIIAGGSIRHVLSCQMQHILEKSFATKHIVGVILIFLFIMQDGGWDFDDKENKKAPNGWDSGNAFHSMIYAIIIYSIFLLSSKSRLLPNILLYTLLFILYFINSYRNYLLVRKNIKEDVNEKLIITEKVLLVISIVVFIYGFIDYYIYKKKNYGKHFEWIQFLFSNKKCAFDGTRDIKGKLLEGH